MQACGRHDMQYTLLYLIQLTSTTASVLQSMGMEMGTVGGGIWIYTEADWRSTHKYRSV